MGTGEVSLDRRKISSGSDVDESEKQSTYGGECTGEFILDRLSISSASIAGKERLKISPGLLESLEQQCFVGVRKICSVLRMISAGSDVKSDVVDEDELIFFGDEGGLLEPLSINSASFLDIRFVGQSLVGEPVFFDREIILTVASEEVSDEE